MVSKPLIENNLSHVQQNQKLKLIESKDRIYIQVKINCHLFVVKKRSSFDDIAERVEQVSIHCWKDYQASLFICFLIVGAL